MTSLDGAWNSDIEMKDFITHCMSLINQVILVWEKKHAFGFLSIPT